MNRLRYLAFIAVLLWHGPAPQQAHTDKVQQNAQSHENPSKGTPAAVNKDSAEENTDKSARKAETDDSETVRVVSAPKIQIETEKDLYDKALVFSTGLLVLVGAFQILYLWRTVQATNVNAAAANEAAKTAKENIELLVQKERARLEIIVGEVPVVGDAVTGVLCYLNNIGPTIAFVEGGGVALVQGTREIEVDFARCTAIPFVGSVPANSRTPTQFRVTLQPETIITQAQALEIRQGQSFIHCYGWVKYKDLFGRGHRVQLHLRWFMRWGGMIEGQIMQWWEPTGKREENSDTEDNSPN